MVTRRSWVVASMLAFCGLIAGLIIATHFNLPSISTSAEVSPPEPVFRIAVPEAAADSMAEVRKISQAFTRIARSVIPIVVSIASTKVYLTDAAEQDGEANSGANDGSRGFKFRVPPRQLRQSGRGSGMILSEDGYILTNVHVVTHAQKIAVTLSDNRTFEAKVVGLDPLTEIAVIKIDAHHLPTALLGNSDLCSVGEWVLAIGNPLDLQSTVTAGIISATGRQIDIIQDSYAVETFIQTDAAINPGNSGGPLVNLRGEVIGINTAIATDTGYDMGFGFAVPINLARRIAVDLIRKGKVVRGYLGIAMQNVDELQARALKLGKPRGVFVDDVFDGSPAKIEGLRPMDVILEIDGQPMNRVNQLQAYIADKLPGTQLQLRCFRDGREFSRTVRLAEKETDNRFAVQNQTTRRTFKNLGVEVDALSDYDAMELGYTANAGVLVTRIEKFSPADEAGLRIDDIITAINRQKVRNQAEFVRIMKSLRPDEVAIFSVFRNRAAHHVFIAVM